MISLYSSSLCAFPIRSTIAPIHQIHLLTVFSASPNIFTNHHNIILLSSCSRGDLSPPSPSKLSLLLTFSTIHDQPFGSELGTLIVPVRVPLHAPPPKNSQAICKLGKAPKPPLPFRILDYYIPSQTITTWRTCSPSDCHCLLTRIKGLLPFVESLFISILTFFIPFTFIMSSLSCKGNERPLVVVFLITSCCSFFKYLST